MYPAGGAGSEAGGAAVRYHFKKCCEALGSSTSVGVDIQFGIHRPLDHFSRQFTGFAIDRQGRTRDMQVFNALSIDRMSEAAHLRARTALPAALADLPQLPRTDEEAVAKSVALYIMGASSDKESVCDDDHDDGDRQ